MEKFILTINNQDAIYTELQSKLALSYASWLAINSDMRIVLTSLKMLKNIIEKESKINKTNFCFIHNNEEVSQDQILLIALYRSAIITYARTFMEANGRNIRLNDSIFKSLTELKEVHRELYKERNTFHAHAGKSKYETILPIIAFTKHDMHLNKLSNIHKQVLNKKPIQLEKYIQLATFVLNYAADKANECEKKLKTEIEPNLLKLYNKAKEGF